MSAKCKAQSAKWRNCVAIIMPPSLEGGVKKSFEENDKL